MRGKLAYQGQAMGHTIMLRYFLCFWTRSGRLANTSDYDSIAHQNSSQLDTEVVESKTMALARLYTVRLTSVDNPVPGNQEFCFAHLETIVGQVKK